MFRTARRGLDGLGCFVSGLPVALNRWQQAIAATADTGYVTRRVRVVFECATQQLDALADGFRTYDKPGPDALHQFVDGDHAR